MEYAIIDSQPEYTPIRKLALSRNQLENPDIPFQVYLWISDGVMVLCVSTLEERIKNYLKNLSIKDELIFDDLFKIKAERYNHNIYVLTLYIKVPSLCNVKVTEEEFETFIKNDT